MNEYNVFQQRHPVPVKTGSKTPEGRDIMEWNVDLKLIGQVQADNGSDAIDLARKKFREFSRASRTSLAAFPIVRAVR